MIVGEVDSSVGYCSPLRSRFEVIYPGCGVIPYWFVTEVNGEKIGDTKFCRGFGGAYFEVCSFVAFSPRSVYGDSCGGTLGRLETDPRSLVRRVLGLDF